MCRNRIARPPRGADHHVTAGLHLPVGLEQDAIAQAVEHERLLRLGYAQFPRDAGMFDRRERAGAGAAVVPADEYLVGVSLGDACGDRAHAHLGHQLHGDFGFGVGALQIVDQLGQILDGVDIVVGRRRDERYAGCRVPQPRDLFGDLVARELASLARLGPLGHLDLQHPRVGQVLDRHAEAGAGHLLDSAVERVAVGERLVPAGSSPPSPVFDMPPSRFMAMASVSWASLLIEPWEMAPV